jgi:hypothetical protein
MSLEEEVRSEVLENLYLAEFTDSGNRNLPSICERNGWEESEFHKVVQRLLHDGVIKGWTMGGNYRIEPAGIVEFESAHDSIIDVIDTNWEIREAALKRLAESFEENSASLGLHYSQIFPDTSWTDHLIVKNLQYLSDQFLVESRATGFFRITFDGIDVVTKAKELDAIGQEFEALEGLDPQRRGVQFQKLFSRILEELGWRALESVRSDSEEIDIVFSRGREYFLVECEWIKDPSEAAIVREVFGKVSNRVGVTGLVVSLSGFTTGAKAQVQKYASQKAILLFGPDDVARIVKNISEFDELLDAKYEALVLRQEVVVS